MTLPAYHVPERPMPLAFEHDKSKGLFVLTWPDGKVEYFRDQPGAATDGRARSRDGRDAAR